MVEPCLPKKCCSKNVLGARSEENSSPTEVGYYPMRKPHSKFPYVDVGGNPLLG
jgi:hypothetical protein